MKMEYKAAVRLLQRSCLNSNIVSATRGFHTSVSRCQQKPQNEDNKNQNDDDKKISSLLTKSILWMLSGYMFIALLSLIFPSSNQPEVLINNVWLQIKFYNLTGK